MTDAELTAALNAQVATLDGSFSLIRDSSYYAVWAKAYKQEVPIVAAYWANGGAAPSGVVSKFGRALIEEAKAKQMARTVLIKVGAPPAPLPVPTGVLRWKPPGYPTYTGYEQHTITNAAKNWVVPFESGRNAVFTIGEIITGPDILIQGWNNVVIIGGEGSMATGTQLSTMFRIFCCTGIVHIEGIKCDKSLVAFDAAIGVSTGASVGITAGATVRVQNSRFQTSPNIGATHDDCLQNWNRSSAFPTGYNGGARAYQIDHCTFISGYQGTFFGNHDGPIGPDPSYISNTNYLPDQAANLGQTIWFWKTYRTDAWGYSSTFYFDTVWIPSYSLTRAQVVPYYDGYNSILTDASRGGSILKDASGNYFQWLATSDCQGIIRIGTPPGGDFCPAGTPGMAYVSPGYL